MLTTAKSGKLRSGIVAALVLGLLFAAVPADAQQGRSEIRDLKKQIVRIEKQLRAVQRRVFGKNFPTVPGCLDANQRNTSQFCQGDIVESASIAAKGRL